MSSVISYEEIAVGAEIPSKTGCLTTRQVVKWAAVTDDFFEIHYDKDFAQSQGLEGVIVHGTLGAAFLTQTITDWIGAVALVKKIGFRYRGIIYPKRNITARGRVVEKYIDVNDRCLKCELWLENDRGEQVTLCEAIVVFPGRG